ncbi:MAG: hypothetical protein WCX73_00890 [Candidatus Pacearchaeota archaeon]|jgi:hypothetical protein
MTGENPFEGLMERVFQNIGARPEPIVVPNVLIGKGDELRNLYVCPQRIGEVYGSEEAARRELGQNQTLYQVNVKRIE